MKAIVRHLFVADDGTEFTSEVDARKHELLCARVNEAMTPLGKHPDADTSRCDFGNGSGYLGHGVHVVDGVRNALLRIAKEYTDHIWIDQSLADPNVDSSWAGRLISECASAPLYRAWHRIMCCDKWGREWGQPYFATHPGKAKNVDLLA